MSQRDEDRKKRDKKQQDWLMAQIIAIMERSLKQVMKDVMDDLFKDFK